MSDKYLLILDIFSANGNEIITAKEIASVLRCSTRSVLRYINILNTIDDKQSFRVISVKNKGFRLQVLDEKSFKEFYKEISSREYLSDEQNRLIFDIALFEPTINYLQEKYNYSHSSINRLVNDINFQISKRRIFINRKNNRLSLEGNEIQVRNFLQYLWETNKNTVKDIIFRIDFNLYDFKQNFKTVQTVNKENLFLNLFLSMLRYSKGHEVKFNQIIHSIYEKYIKTNEQLKKFDDYYKCHIGKEICPDEMIYISLVMGDGKDDYDLYNNSVNTLTPIINKVLSQIDKRYATKFEGDEELINAICCHISGNLTRYILQSHSVNELLNQIRLNYTNEHVYALEVANMLHTMLDISISDDEIGYITLHLAACSEKKRETENFDVTILYKQSLTTAKLLQIRINERFPELNTQIVNYTEFNDNTPNCIVLVFEKELKYIGAVKINPFLDTDDIDKVNKAIIAKQGFVPFLQVYHQDEFHLVDENTSCEFDRFSFLKWATEILVKKRRLSMAEALDILKREELSSTEIASGVAFPHCTISGSSFLAVFLLRQPIFWQKNYVRMVLIMGYNKKNSGNRKAIKYLFSNISDANKLEKLIMAESSDEFLKIMRG